MFGYEGGFEPGPFERAEKQERQEGRRELSPDEKDDINAAIETMNKGGLGMNRADAIILSYGLDAIPFLQEKQRNGEIPEEALDYYQAKAWDAHYSQTGDSSALMSLIQLLRGAPAERQDRKEEGSEYQFFRFPEAREELYKFCKSVADYLHDNNITNLAMMDRSSRPMYVGVGEYWKSAYPNEPKPNMYFMNPKGFKAREDMTPDEILEVIEDCEWKGDVSEGESQVRTRKEILDEIDATYIDLAKEKDKPLLVFDTCLHSGRTLEPVINALKEDGFENVLVGSVNKAPSDSVVQTDFAITRKHPEMGCYPFDKDRIVEKTFDHVYAMRTEDPAKRAAARQLRAEIKTIMQEQIEANSDAKAA